MRKDIILIGGGGHCKSVIDVIEQEEKFNIVGIIDKKELVGQNILGYDIIDCDENIKKYTKIKNALIAVGQVKSPDIRIRLFKICCDAGFNLPIIISPLAYVSKHSHIDIGTIVMHHVLINANAKVGKNCIINSKALIEHDAIIGDNCHISTASVINGGVVVSDNTFFGSNATTKQLVVVSGFIKAGGVVK